MRARATCVSVPEQPVAVLVGGEVARPVARRGAGVATRMGAALVAAGAAAPAEQQLPGQFESM